MKLLTSYIAHLNKVTAEIRQIQVDLGERSFPCCVSNDISGEDIREWPFCSTDKARKFSEDRLACVLDPDLAYFFLFKDLSERNEIAAFELGLAIQNPKTTIVMIGSKPRSSIHTFPATDKLIHCYDYDNFVSLRFFA